MLIPNSELHLIKSLQDKVYRVDHKEDARAYNKAYRAKNKAHLDAKKLEYHKEHRDEILAKNKVRKDESGRLSLSSRSHHRQAHMGKGD